MRAILSMLIWIAGIYTAYCGILYLLQRQMMYPRHLTVAAAFPRQGTGAETESAETIWLDVGGDRVESRLYLPEITGFERRLPAVIFAHGNAELIAGGPDDFLDVTRWGMALLMVEYPGYGRSGGAPTQESITRAFLTAYDSLVTRTDIDPERIVLMGRSLGGGAVCQLAARRPSAAMVLISTFTSARAFAKRYLAPGFLVRDPFDNLTVIQNYPKPVLIFHGEMDGIIPHRHGQALAQAAPDARLISFFCGHNDLPPTPLAFRRPLLNFLYDNGLIDKPEPTDPLI